MDRKSNLVKCILLLLPCSAFGLVAAEDASPVTPPSHCASLPRPQNARAVRALGAHIELCGDDYDTACEMAIAFSRASGGYFIHPFDNPEVIAGQGTLGVDLTQQLETPPGVIFIPIGGGGLAAGVAATVKAVYPQVRIIGVEPEDAASMQVLGL